MCYSFFLFTYAHSLRFPCWNFNRSFEFPLELFSELSAVWKLWGGERIDPLLWTSPVPKAVTARGSTWAGSRLLLAGEVHCQALFLGVWIHIGEEFGHRIQHSLSSSWAALALMPRGPVAAAASFRFLCTAKYACKRPGFQQCCISIPQNRALKNASFFRHFEYFEQICHVFIHHFLIWNVLLSRKPFSWVLPRTTLLSTSSLLKGCPSLSTFSIAETLKGSQFIRLRLFAAQLVWNHLLYFFWDWFWEALMWLPAKMWIFCSGSVCIHVCAPLAAFKCFAQFQPNLMEFGGLANSKFPQGLSRRAEVEERCPTSAEEKTAMLYRDFMGCWWIRSGDSSHLSTPPRGLQSTHTPALVLVSVKLKESWIS